MGQRSDEAYAELIVVVNDTKATFGRLILEPVERFLMRLRTTRPGVLRQWLKATESNSVETLAQYIQALDFTGQLRHEPPQMSESESSVDEEGTEPSKGEQK